MLKVGLTGKIASGKSAVENILRQKGFLVIDLDIISHDILEDEKIKNNVVKIFKTSSRKELAKIVFDDEEKRKTLENIIHPEIKKYILDLFEKNKNEKIIFISGALLYETGFDKLFDKIILIDSDVSLRKERLKKRNNYSDIEIEKRINSQNKDYKSKADFVVDNSGSIEELKLKIEEIINKLK